jgi:hypothetical protein
MYTCVNKCKNDKIKGKKKKKKWSSMYKIPIKTSTIFNIKFK